MKKYYMHTLDGKPAFFDEQTNLVCFAVGAGGARYFNILVPSLKEIKFQRAKSQRVEMPNNFEYGHVLVYAP